MIKTLKTYKHANFSLLTRGTKEISTTNFLYNAFGFVAPSCSLYNSPFSLILSRHYHNKKFHRHLKAIYALHKDRRTTLVPFEEKPIKICQDLRSNEAVKAFFKEFLGKGGIYKFSLKNKPNVFYIGSTRNFYKRFKQHTGKDAWFYYDDLFHNYADNIGWDKFEFAILEILEDLPALRKRENYYLQKYAPLLNMKLKSTISTTRYQKEASSLNSKDPSKPKDPSN